MSSVLETFFFMFESDADKLDKGIKDSDKQVDKLQKNLQDTDKTAGMVGSSLLKLATSFGAAIGGMLAFSAVKATILETADAMDSLGDSAAALDLPVEELSAWSMAATMMDGTQEGFIASLNQFNVGLNDVATKGKGRLLPFLKEMGLSMADVKRGAKEPLWALQQMSEKFGQLTRSEAAGLGNKLGLDQGTINLLSQGRRGIEEIIKRQKELGVQTAAQTEAAAKLDEQLKENSATYNALKRDFVTAVLPVVTAALEWLRKVTAWATEHKTAVVAFIGGVATVLTAAYLPAMIRAAAATWALIAPFALVALAVIAFGAALALVIDDLWAYLHGQDSVIGEAVKKWPLLGAAIDAVGGVLVALLETARSVFAFFVDLVTQGPEAAIKNFDASMKTLIADIVDRFPAVGRVFQTVTGVMADAMNFVRGVFDSVTGGMILAIESVIRVWTWLVDKFTAGIALFKGGLGILNNLAGGAARVLGFEIASPAQKPTGATVRGAPGDKVSSSSPVPGRGVEAGRTSPAAFMPPQTREAVAAGQQQITVTNTPLAAQTSSSISNSSSRTVHKTTNVEVGGITVNTQATDGAQVASALNQELGTQMRGAIDQNDDGVLA